MKDSLDVEHSYKKSSLRCLWESGPIYLDCVRTAIIYAEVEVANDDKFDNCTEYVNQLFRAI